MTESGRKRRTFPEAFKLEAVAAVRGGRSVSQVAAELGLPDRLVRAWLRWAEACGRAGSGAAAPRPASAWRSAREGAINNLTNPKPLLFMFAFLPQFVDPAAGPARPNPIPASS